MAKPGKTDETPAFEADDLRKGSNRAGFASQQLYSFVERLERLDEERQALVADMKEVRSEAKGIGFDTKILGIVLRRRKMDTATRQEQDSILELYEDAVRQESARQTTQSEEDGE